MSIEDYVCLISAAISRSSEIIIEPDARNDDTDVAGARHKDHSFVKSEEKSPADKGRLTTWPPWKYWTGNECFHRMFFKPFFISLTQFIYQL